MIARNTAFTYKGKPLDVKTIGRELNVRYVLEGSVQRGGNRMRVNVQLIDAETGSHLWAERFDKPLADLFDMQDEIVARLANALNAQLAAAEARRAEQAPNPEFDGPLFSGPGLGPSRQNPEPCRASAELFRSRARRRSRQCRRARRIGGGRHRRWREIPLSPIPASAFAAAEAKLSQGSVVGPQDHARGHVFLGYVEDPDQARQRRESPNASMRWRSIGISPTRMRFIGLGKIFIGSAAEAEAHISEALRLSPRDTSAYVWLTEVGHREKSTLAIGSRRSRGVGGRSRPTEIIRKPTFTSAAALARLGRLEEARAAVKGGLALNPSFTVSRARTNWTAMSDDPAHPQQLAPIFEALRQAGLPEQ